MNIPKEIFTIIYNELPLSDLYNIKLLSKEFYRCENMPINEALEQNITSYRHPVCIFLDAIYRGDVEEVNVLLQNTKPIDRELRMVTWSMIRDRESLMLTGHEIAKHKKNKLISNLLMQQNVPIDYDNTFVHEGKDYELIIASCRGDINWFNKLVSELQLSKIDYHTIDLCTWAAVKNGDISFLKNLSLRQEFNEHTKRFNSGVFLYGAALGFSQYLVFRKEISDDQKISPFLKDNLIRGIRIFKSGCFDILRFDDKGWKIAFKKDSGHLPEGCSQRFLKSVDFLQQEVQKKIFFQKKLMKVGLTAFVFCSWYAWNKYSSDDDSCVIS